MLEWLAGDSSNVVMQTRVSLDFWKSSRRPPHDEEGQANGDLMRATSQNGTNRGLKHIILVNTS